MAGSGGCDLRIRALEEEILAELLPKPGGPNFHGAVENAASEQGARMTAMDNAPATPAT
jgi:F0F1-type ATP synthase gamma subunit